MGWNIKYVKIHAFISILRNKNYNNIISHFWRMLETNSLFWKLVSQNVNIYIVFPTRVIKYLMSMFLIIKNAVNKEKRNDRIRILVFCKP